MSPYRKYHVGSVRGNNENSEMSAGKRILFRSGGHIEVEAHVDVEAATRMLAGNPHMQRVHVKASALPKVGECFFDRPTSRGQLSSVTDPWLRQLVVRQKSRRGSFQLRRAQTQVKRKEKEWTGKKFHRDEELKVITSRSNTNLSALN